MTVIFYKLSIVAVVLVLLAGCSSLSDLPFARIWSTQQVEEQSRFELPVAFEACLPEAGSPFSYRKVILVAGTIGVPDLPRDLPGVASITSKRLQTHLEALERFNVVASHDTSFESTALDTAARVRQFGREYEAQFVVKLEIHDLTMNSSGGWLSKLVGATTERNVLIKAYIYDTEYGALFHAQEYQDSISGNVVGYPGTGRSVTLAWLNTDLGTRIDQILKAISMQINEKLACVPFSTEVTAVEGNDIHINAGYLHGIRPGETLRVYRRSYLSLPDGTQQQGTLKQGENEGWITVNAVFPNYSIASTTQDNVGGIRLDAGDVVRAW
jgi:hypothetical protein